MSDTSCRRCEGCGQIANSEDGEPWIYWQNLPREAKAAVILGIVRPIPCPDCQGKKDGG